MHQLSKVLNIGTINGTKALFQDTGREELQTE